MKRILSYTSVLLLLPFFAHAQNLQTFFKNLLTFINTAIIPFILGIAFLIFIINVIRFFIIGAGNEESREKAKNLAIYGVFAFVFIIVFWGIVNLLSSSIGLDGKTATTSDYVRIKGGEFKGGEPTNEFTRSEKEDPRNPSCGSLEQMFDNVFGGPCATNNPTNSVPNTGDTNNNYTNSSSRNWSSGNADYSDNTSNNTNQKPQKPTIDGTRDTVTSYGYVGTDITFILQSKDPENNRIYYQILWSDYPEDISQQSNEVLLNYPTNSSIVPSDTPITVTRHWNVPGSYFFMVRAIDTDKNQSDWTTRNVIINDRVSNNNDAQVFDNNGFLISN